MYFYKGISIDYICIEIMYFIYFLCHRNVILPYSGTLYSPLNISCYEFRNCKNPSNMTWTNISLFVTQLINNLFSICSSKCRLVKNERLWQQTSFRTLILHFAFHLNIKFWPYCISMWNKAVYSGRYIHIYRRLPVSNCKTLEEVVPNSASCSLVGPDVGSVAAAALPSATVATVSKM